VGLFRSEFLFMDRHGLPGEEEQYRVYQAVAEATAPHAVIIRTLDLGGDKLPTFVGVAQDAAEMNPFLGWRAIRFCLQESAIFRAQLRAILRASAEGNVKIMYPMISGLEELTQSNELVEQCKQELASAGIPFNPFVEVGIMIEIPSAVLVAEHLAREVRFFSIGTNDLIQYSIAVDRLNDRIAHLYNPTHPSILRMIKMTVDAGKANGIWTGVCGEMASDIQLTPLLIGLGVDELSASTALVPRIKKAVQSLDSAECENLVREVLGMDDSNAILDRARSMARENYAELID